MPEQEVILTPDLLDIWRGLCLNSFRFFCKTFMDPKWFDDDFHGPLCDELQSEEAPDKLIVMPRTHLKTTICGVMYPIWRACKNVNIRILLVYNSADNAKKTVHSIRAFIESDKLFAVLFPEVIPTSFTSKGVRWSDECACVNREIDHPEGTFEAAGTSTNIIRRHYDVIVEDDTLAPKKDQYTDEEVLPSLEEIQKAIGFHKLTIPLLIPPIEDCTRLTVGTRWAAVDVIQHITNYEIKGMPGGRYSVYDVAAYKEDGSPSFKRFSVSALEGIRAALGPYMFSALYLNQPMASEFMKFRPEWTRYYDEPSDVGFELFKEAQEDGMVVVAVDPADAPTGKSSQDYSGITAALHSKSGMFVLAFKRARLSEGDLINESLDMADSLDAQKIRVEVDRYAHLEAGFQSEMRRRGKYYVIDAVKTRGRKKESRILRLAPLHQNGQLYFTRSMKVLENELYQFPRGSHDDIIDSLAWHVLSDFELPDYHEEKEPPRTYDPFSIPWDVLMGSFNQSRGRRDLPFDLQLHQPVIGD